MIQSLHTHLPHTSFQQVNVQQAESLEDLFKRVTEDDYGAFKSIFNSSYDMLCSCAHRVVKNRELSEEIVDDVFCNLWRNRKKIQITMSFRAYLMASIRNKSLDSLRKLKHEKTLMLESASGVPCGQSIAFETLSYDELHHRIDVAIQALPGQCRRIFLMSRDENLKYKEIAESLHISIKTVDTQIGRALKHLRKTIRPTDL